MPCFHKSYPAWSEALGRWEANRVGQRRRGNAFVFGNPFDPIHKLMRRVTMRAGSLILWNQTTVHGAMPNASANFRAAQFVRGFRAGELTPARAAKRAAGVRRELQTAGLMGELTPLAQHVFGLAREEAFTPAAVAGREDEPQPQPQVTEESEEQQKNMKAERRDGDGSLGLREPNEEGPPPQPPRSVQVGERWPGAWPGQLTSEQAADFGFETLMDLIPNDQAVFLCPTHPAIDSREPMRYSQLRQLAASLRADPALAGLQQQGLRGARIATALPSEPDLAALFLALTDDGTFVLAPMNP